mmetsp:Transcript_2469/g.6344  ORF Transcript_2469/g.6344 Transcript_2469/m.6344 type:complete len:455 (-) Transcript_2469:356-1720(-)|eukprot:CAMPEP_0202859042 /NCGR_PEP_ID=MMETSP1391-20130828/1331_1 /ASSEMBLY_ACC=CAM_ASM_000867 /TAXON_ID=1034604 /ORGANISM="Chlamydomonas leiostraca, Strain SAG 11-49" /LENGTH=454 /DNA_ID=CAMNT_0049538043 /DNA_START=306 /DNA_END=1670 /DNA_ORIENTATION=+
MAAAQPRAAGGGAAAGKRSGAGDKAFIQAPNAKPVHLVLSKNLTRSLQSGHPWLYADALESLPAAPAGSLALIKTKAGDIVAKGMYDPKSPIAFRSLAVRGEVLDDALVGRRLERCAAIRGALFSDARVTCGFRLVNGEGDGLPGLVIDVYGDVAVIKLDGASPNAFYSPEAVAAWLMARYARGTGTVAGEGAGRPLRSVYLKFRANEGAGERGRLVAGQEPNRATRFTENGAAFHVDVVAGQKTGFFLDQRDNRARVGRLCAGGGPRPGSNSSKGGGPRMLNVFGYTGGFSIYAGRAGAAHVTTVDVAAAALQAAEVNWEMNGLPAPAHTTASVDAFKFLEDAVRAKEVWDVVVIDPPSFAPNKAAVATARDAYERAFGLAAQVTAENGVVCMASCSSHINSQLFSEVCAGALSRARRRGYCLGVSGQPEDHPWPAAAEELRYLKFAAYALEG